jgi:hypothetical protein
MTTQRPRTLREISEPQQHDGIADTPQHRVLVTEPSSNRYECLEY